MLADADSVSEISRVRMNFYRALHVNTATKHEFCLDKSMLVATKLLSRQTRKHNFVATKLLSW